MASNTLDEMHQVHQRYVRSSSSGPQLTKIGHIFYSTVFKCDARTQGRRFLVAMLIYTRKAANKCDFQILYIDEIEIIIFIILWNGICGDS